MSAIEINKGECLSFDGTWPVEGGLHGKTISVVESYPKDLMATQVTVLDPDAGTFRAFAGSELSAAMRAGQVNWIRLGLSENGGCMDTTPRIWINVQ